LVVGAVNRNGVDRHQLRELVSDSQMTNLNAFAATSTAHFWWRGSTIAARWRD
jgi:hypothetical protein